VVQVAVYGELVLSVTALQPEIAAPPSVKATVPVGATVPGAVTETVAV